MSKSVPRNSPAIVPSYLAKVHRAEKHLINLKREIDRYAGTKPYTVGQRIEGKRKKKTHRLTFTGDPANTDIPIIAADAIYNLRSSLDHLMSALVANKDRGSAMFPVFFQGVWEAIVPGENQQRIKSRMRWASDIKTVAPEAIAILKELQPPDDGGDATTEYNLLRFVNGLSNRDRHEKLPVLVTGLRNPTGAFKWPDGSHQPMSALTTDPDGFFNDGAKIAFPDGAVDVEIEGTPVIVVRVGEDKGAASRYLELLPELQMTRRMIEDRTIPALAPFVQRP